MKKEREKRKALTKSLFFWTVFIMRAGKEVGRMTDLWALNKK
jgi:hypothetical protein